MSWKVFGEVSGGLGEALGGPGWSWSGPEGFMGESLGVLRGSWEVFGAGREGFWGYFRRLVGSRRRAKRKKAILEN